VSEHHHWRNVGRIGILAVVGILALSILASVAMASKTVRVNVIAGFNVPGPTNPLRGGQSEIYTGKGWKSSSHVAKFVRVRNGVKLLTHKGEKVVDCDYEYHVKGSAEGGRILWSGTGVLPLDQTRTIRGVSTEIEVMSVTANLLIAGHPSVTVPAATEIS
jgi:hypothetical protein